LAQVAAGGNRRQRAARSCVEPAREGAVLIASSAIYAIDYEIDDQRLHVTFMSGERYVYADVPGEICLAFLQADSKGRFFQAEIRDRYAYRRLDGRDSF
jgi:lysyl-tRNA synthetase class 2